MAYVKTNWQTGDVITAEKLNNMEGGIEAATPLIVENTSDVSGTITLSAKFKDIKAAYPNVAYKEADLENDGKFNYYPIILCSEGTLSVAFLLSDAPSYMTVKMTALSEDDYPTYTDSWD